MVKFSTLRFIVFALHAGFAGCSGASSSAPAPAAPQSAEPPVSNTDVNAASRPALTAQACEAGGGAIVGDIGDGAIHRPEYRCPNGAKPTGSIAAAEGAPLAIEGSVCCPR